MLIACSYHPLHDLLLLFPLPLCVVHDRTPHVPLRAEGGASAGGQQRGAHQLVANRGERISWWPTHMLLESEPPLCQTGPSRSQQRYLSCAVTRRCVGSSRGAVTSSTTIMCRYTPLRRFEPRCGYEHCWRPAIPGRWRGTPSMRRGSAPGSRSIGSNWTAGSAAPEGGSVSGEGSRGGRYGHALPMRLWVRRCGCG